MEEKIGELPMIGQIAKLKVEPGDILVMMVKEHISKDAHERMGILCRKLVGDHPILILDGGVTLSVLSVADLKERLEKV